MPYQAAEPRSQAQPRPPRSVSGNGCAGCPTACAEACFNDAIRRSGAAIDIDAGRCAGCGGCVGACRYGRIAVVRGVARFLP